MAFTSPTEQRNLLTLSFEPADEGYVYYHHRWSRGIPVTAEEREAYLSIPALGSRSAWRKSLAGRATVAPRDYKPVRHKILAATPRRMAVFGLLFGIAGIASAFGERSPFLAAAYGTAGFAMLVFGGSIAVAHVMQSRNGAIGP